MNKCPASPSHATHERHPSLRGMSNLQALMSGPCRSATLSQVSYHMCTLSSTATLWWQQPVASDSPDIDICIDVWSLCHRRPIRCVRSGPLYNREADAGDAMRHGWAHTLQVPAEDICNGLQNLQGQRVQYCKAASGYSQSSCRVCQIEKHRIQKPLAH